MSAKEVLADADHKLTRPELVERIMFAVDGYRFGEWSLADAGARILKLIEQNPEAAL